MNKAMRNRGKYIRSALIDAKILEEKDIEELRGKIGDHYITTDPYLEGVVHILSEEVFHKHFSKFVEGGGPKPYPDMSEINNTSTTG